MTERKQNNPTWINVREALSNISREELISTISDLYKLRKENKRLLLGRYGHTASPLDDIKPNISPESSVDDNELNIPSAPSLEDNEPNISPEPSLDDDKPYIPSPPSLEDNEPNISPEPSLDDNESNISPALSLDDDKPNISPEPSLEDNEPSMASASALDGYKLKITSAVNPRLARKISFKDASQAINEYKKVIRDPEGVAELMVFYCEECAGTIKRIGLWEQYAAGTINIWLDTLKYIQKLPQQLHSKFWKRLNAAQKLMGQAGWGVTDMLDIYMFKYSPYAEGDEDLP